LQEATIAKRMADRGSALTVDAAARVDCVVVVALTLSGLDIILL
jgi:hypothetical protein